jgi:hypothetical protein
MKSIWQVDNVTLAMWSWQFHDMELRIWQCGMGNGSMWSWQHSRGNAEVWCCWEHLKYQCTLGNMVRTHLKLDMNTLRKSKSRKFNHPSPLLSKGEKIGVLECMLHHLIGWIEFQFLTMFVIHFCLD